MDSWQDRVAGVGCPWRLGLQHVGEGRCAGHPLFTVPLPFVKAHSGLKGRCCVSSHLTEEETEARNVESPAQGPTQVKHGAGIKPGVIQKLEPFYFRFLIFKKLTPFFILQNSCMLSTASETVSREIGDENKNNNNNEIPSPLLSTAHLKYLSDVGALLGGLSQWSPCGGHQGHLSSVVPGDSGAGPRAPILKSCPC